MARINLKASNAYETAILKYLEDNASNMLVAKINQNKKTLTDCMDFIKSAAKKEAVKGVAVIEDSKVYGWAVHFFEEDEIKPGKEEKYQEYVEEIASFKKPAEPVAEEKHIRVVKPKTVVSEQLPGQTSIFDLM